MILFIVLVPVSAHVSYRRAWVRGTREPRSCVPFCFGFANLILWNPGETVIILDRKKLVKFERPRPRRSFLARLQGAEYEDDAPQGGYAVIFPVLGQEYVSTITTKTKLMDWTSEKLHTSNGVPVMLKLSIWWRIENRNLYFSRIAEDFHRGRETHRHPSQPKGEAAELWIRTLVGDAGASEPSAGGEGDFVACRGLCHASAHYRW